MSAENGTNPVPASSGFSVWTLVRVAGIIVGIATLLRVAANEKLVTYDPLFQHWLDIVSEFIDWAFLTQFIGPLLREGIDYVRSFGIYVPDLQDEWRTAYILSMLMFGKFARHSRGWWTLPAALLCALVIAVWSGLTGSFGPVPIGAAFTAAFAFKGDPGKGAIVQFARSALLAFAFTFAVGVAYGAGTVVGAGTVAFVAAVLLITGAVDSVSGGRGAVFSNALFNIGIDVLGVMLGALGIASLFANPPIW